MKIKLKTFSVALLIIVIICVAIVIINLVINKPYFSQFRDKQEVKTHLLSIFSLEKSSYKDVQDAIKDKKIGELECSSINLEPNVNEETIALICDALKTRFSFWYYRLVFTFNNGVLGNLDVYEVYLGL